MCCGGHIPSLDSTQPAPSETSTHRHFWKAPAESHSFLEVDGRFCQKATDDGIQHCAIVLLLF